MMDRCENCARLEDELRLTRDALALCRSALTACQERSNRLRSQIIKLQRISGLADRYDIHDFAERADSTAMTVWKWKQRYPDFPRPVPGSYPAQYERTDVDAFLERHPRLAKKGRGR